MKARFRWVEPSSKPSAKKKKVKQPLIVTNNNAFSSEIPKLYTFWKTDKEKSKGPFRRDCWNVTPPQETQDFLMVMVGSRSCRTQRSVPSFINQVATRGEPVWASAEFLKRMVVICPCGEMRVLQMSLTQVPLCMVRNASSRFQMSEIDQIYEYWLWLFSRKGKIPCPCSEALFLLFGCLFVF